MSRKLPLFKNFQSVIEIFWIKKLQTSLRYSNVKPKINTGFNALKRHEIEKEIVKYYKVRSDEVFKRISIGDLMQLILLYGEASNLTELPTEFVSKGTETVEDLNEEMCNTQLPVANANSMSNVECKSNDVEAKAFPDDTNDDNQTIPCPYLLLDIREENYFNKGHLATAICHPHFRLSRSVGWECGEMLEYKNHPEWIIVVYDDNELLSPEVASVLIHRGYTNIFVLSGGLRLVQDKIGYPFVTTDRSKELTTVVVGFLTEKLLNTIIPPLRLHDTDDWWEVKSSKSRREDSGFCGKNQSSGDKLIQPTKKIPWR